MEEVEVVAEEQEEKPQEQGQEEPGPSPKSASLEALEALKVLQLELEPVNRECRRQHFRLKLTTLRRRKPYLEHRSTIIQSIPGFWVKVVSLILYLRDHVVAGLVQGVPNIAGRSGTKMYPLDCALWAHSGKSDPEIVGAC